MLLEFKRTTECVYLFLWGPYSGNETLSNQPEVVGRELDIDAGKAWAGGLPTEEAVPVIPGGEPGTGSPSGLEG